MRCSRLRRRPVAPPLRHKRTDMSVPAHWSIPFFAAAHDFSPFNPFWAVDSLSLGEFEWPPCVSMRFCLIRRGTWGSPWASRTLKKAHGTCGGTARATLRSSDARAPVQAAASPRWPLARAGPAASRCPAHHAAARACAVSSAHPPARRDAP